MGTRRRDQGDHLRVLDDCTRLLAAIRAHPAETADGAIHTAEHAVREMGAPALWLTDNGAAFTARLTFRGKGISAFTRKILSFGWLPGQIVTRV